MQTGMIRTGKEAAGAACATSAFFALYKRAGMDEHNCINL